MRKLLMVAVLALALTGCGPDPEEQEATPTTPAGGQGEPFLPAYLDMLQGKRPFPADNSCAPAHDLASLMIPCDQP